MRHSCRHRTPPRGDEREDYETPEQAGRGGGRVGIVGKRRGGSKPSPLSLKGRFLSSQQTLSYSMLSASGASGRVTEEGKEGEVVMARTKRLLGLVLSRMGHCVLERCT